MVSGLQGHRSQVLLLFCLALLLRSLGLSSRPIWYDEAFSILLSEKGPAAILSGTISADSDASAAEEHPPGYYMLLWGWITLFGNSAFASRILSILAGMGVVVYVYRIARQLFDEPTAQTATLLAAILPFQVHYAQEIRMYVFMALWLCGATDAFLRRQWILFAVFAAMAQYTHTLSIFYLSTLGLTPVLQKDWKTFRALAGAAALAVVLYLPWFVQLPAQISKVTGNFWVDRPGPEKLFTLLLYYLPHLPLPDWQLMAGLLLSTLTITLGILQTIRSYENKPFFKSKGGWLAYLAFAPAGLLWLISQFHPIYIERALLPSHAVFCIWLAWTLTRPAMLRPFQIFAFSAVGLCAILGLYQHVNYKGFPYGPYSEIDQYLEGKVQPGDMVVHSSKLSYLPAFYFNEDLPQTYIVDPAGGRTDTLSPTTQAVLNLSSLKSIQDVHSSRVWFIMYEQSIREYQLAGRQTHPHIEYLENNLQLELTQQWDDVNVYLFSRAVP